MSRRSQSPPARPALDVSPGRAFGVMRPTQASVKVFDALSRTAGLPLPVVRYDLRHSSAAAWHGAEPTAQLSSVSLSLLRLTRKWLVRRLGLSDNALLALLEAEERIDVAIVEQLEKGVPTTCGGYLVSQ